MTTTEVPAITPAAERLWESVHVFLRAYVADADVEPLERMQRANALAVTVHWTPAPRIVVVGVDRDGRFEQAFDLCGRRGELN